MSNKIQFDFSGLNPTELARKFGNQSVMAKSIAIAVVIGFFATIAGAFIVYPQSTKEPDRTDSYVSKLQSATVSGAVDKQRKSVQAQLDDGTKVTVTLKDSVVSSLVQGDSIKVYRLSERGSTSNQYSFYDIDRTNQMIILFAIYLVLLIAICRFKGLIVGVSLTLGFIVLYLFTIPCLYYSSSNPYLVAVLTALLILYATTYLSGGITMKNTVTFVGTFFGTACAVGVVFITVNWMKLVGQSSEASTALLAAHPGISFEGIVICGMVIAIIGILQDMARTQVEIVYLKTHEMETEAAAHQTRFKKPELFWQSLRAGGSHASHTIFMLVYAFIGCSIFSFIWVMTSDQPFLNKLANSAVADEIAASLGCGIALLLGYVLVTLVATLTVPSSVAADGVPLPPPAPDLLMAKALRGSNAAPGTIATLETPTPTVAPARDAQPSVADQQTQPEVYQQPLVLPSLQYQQMPALQFQQQQPQGGQYVGM